MSDRVTTRVNSHVAYLNGTYEPLGPYIKSHIVTLVNLVKVYIRIVQMSESHFCRSTIRGKYIVKGLERVTTRVNSQVAYLNGTYEPLGLYIRTHIVTLVNLVKVYNI